MSREKLRGTLDRDSFEGRWKLEAEEEGWGFIKRRGGRKQRASSALLGIDGWAEKRTSRIHPLVAEF